MAIPPSLSPSSHTAYYHMEVLVLPDKQEEFLRYGLLANRNFCAQRGSFLSQPRRSDPTDAQCVTTKCSRRDPAPQGAHLASISTPPRCPPRQSSFPLPSVYAAPDLFKLSSLLRFGAIF
jgi:hypothetical protein